jgi:hypothetical protein
MSEGFERLNVEMETVAAILKIGRGVEKITGKSRTFTRASDRGGKFQKVFQCKWIPTKGTTIQLL